MTLKTPSQITLTHFQFENIIIWRHADAEQADAAGGDYDVMRQLTSKGKTQAKHMARWLRQHLPKGTKVVCSPAIRALQTAEALSYKVQTNDSLKPSAGLLEVLRALAQLDEHPHILIVGHQPWLGQLVSFLFEQTASEHTETIVNNLPKYNNTSIKKGAVWWLRLRPNDTTSSPNLTYQLFTVQTPSLL